MALRVVVEVEEPLAQITTAVQVASALMPMDKQGEGQALDFSVVTVEMVQGRFLDLEMEDKFTKKHQEAVVEAAVDCMVGTEPALPVRSLSGLMQPMVLWGEEAGVRTSILTLAYLQFPEQEEMDMWIFSITIQVHTNNRT